MQIAFIGGGNMGEAMVAAVLRHGLVGPGGIIVSDIAQARLDLLKKKFRVATTRSNLEAMEGAEVVVLAIKPQNLPEVLSELNGRLKSSQLVLSIVAGARLKSLSLGLGHNRIVRAMPNTPAQIGEGISVWTATEAVNRRQRKWASSILRAMGREVYVDNEDYLDMATAISGSGPAYFFYMVESLVEAAVRIGLPRQMAFELVLQTMLGSAQLLQRSGKEPAELRQMVTSPGGTTAQALQKLEEGRFAELIKKAVEAAYKRAKELGK